MFRFLAALASSLLTLIFLSSPGWAQTTTGEPSHLVFGLGAYNHNENGAGEAEADFRAEYRVGYRLFNVIRPFAAGEITSDGSVWGGVGIAAELPLGESWFIGASFAPGLYAQGGSDLDLGGSVQFRSQAEIGYKFASERRLSLSYSHISNAGLDEENPGSEVITVYYHVPF